MNDYSRVYIVGYGYLEAKIIARDYLGWMRIEQNAFMNKEHKRILITTIDDIEQRIRGCEKVKFYMTRRARQELKPRQVVELDHYVDCGRLEIEVLDH